MHLTKIKSLWRHFKYLDHNHFRLTSTYVQGQSPEPKIREYFYFVNHEGMVIVLVFLVKMTQNMIFIPFLLLQSSFWMMLV